MSSADTTAARATARAAQSMISGLAARMGGKEERGRDRKVRRDSYDVADRRAQVSRRIGDGTAAGALSWIDCLLKTVSEWDDVERRKKGGRPLGLYGLRVLETLLGRRGSIAPEFKSGRLEPAIDTIARVARTSRTTVIRALARLRAMRVLDWVRRSERAATAGEAGPQRRQVSNAYWFTPELLPARVYQRLRDLVARRALRRARAAPSEPRPDSGPANPELREVLDRMAEKLGASSPYGLYPCSGVKG